MKLNSIQFLRAVAALLVVYVHSIDLQMGYAVSKQQNFLHLQNFGAIGVDLFFVISGFIITYVASKYIGVEQGFLFLAKRFNRINPVYYIASGLYFGIFVAQLAIVKNTVPISFDVTLSQIIDTLLIIPTSGHSILYIPLLTIGWTLSFEWLFYLLFFTVIISKTRYKITLLSSLICALVFLGYKLQVHDFRYSFITNPIILEFLLGIGICQLYLKVQKIPNWIPFTCLLIGILSYIVLIVVGFGQISELGSVLTGQLSMKRFLLWGVPSALVAFGCIFIEKYSSFKSFWNNKWILLIGDASYSIYLVHLIAFSLFKILYKKVGFFMPADIGVIVQLIVAVVISIFFYKGIEKPLITSRLKPSIIKPDKKPLLKLKEGLE